jgi:hypothetical protein
VIYASSLGGCLFFLAACLFKATAIVLPLILLASTIILEKPIEFTGGPNAVGDERQALSRAIVDHNEDTQATPIDELMNWHRRPCAQGPLAPAPAVEP